MEIVLIPAVIGFIEFLRKIQERDWFDTATIVGAALIGVILGAVHAPGVADVWTGLVGGLAASGVVTTAVKINKAPATPTVVK